MKSDRSKKIIKTSLVGILGNVFLCIFKLGVGLAANSIAIMIDAVNNISDALSSVITIIGAKLSAKDPDRNHPFGYGRVEFLSALVIGAIILYVGVTGAVESVQRIITPEKHEYTLHVIVVIVTAAAAKIGMGLYALRHGRELDSQALMASGHEAFDDAMASGTTLVAALVYIYLHVDIEAYVGLAISCLIIRTGIKILKETINEILGERVSVELASRVRESILTFPEVGDVFDLVIHNYGKEKLYGSAYIEVPEGLKASWIDNLQRAISKKVLEDTGVVMLGLSIYAVNTRDERAAEMEEDIRQTVTGIDKVLRMNGFYLDEVDKEIRFNAVIDFDTADKAAVQEAIKDAVKQKHHDYEVSVALEYDIAG